MLRLTLRNLAAHKVRLIMSTLAIVLGVAVVIGLAGSAAAQDARAKGEQVYVAQKCSICHSIAGKGNPKGPLDGVGSKLTPDDIRQWIVDAKGMTLYVFDNDKEPGKSACNEGCAKAWPPSFASSASNRWRFQTLIRY